MAEIHNLHYNEENNKKSNLFQGILKWIFGILIFGLIFIGIIFMIKRERDNQPKYTIYNDRTHWMTDTFSIDSNQCIKFKAIEISLFHKKVKDVEICGGRYTIEAKSKWKD